MAYINYRENNPLYSPGLSTYTSKAEKGDDGENGFSLYYNDGIISDNENEKNRVIQNILSGSNLSSSDASSIVIEYKTGDLIIDGSSDIYKIDLSDSTSVELIYIGCIRQSIGKIYTTSITNETVSISVINELQNITDTDSIVTYTLDKDYRITKTAANIKYVKLINTVTGEVAIFKY